LGTLWVLVGKRPTQSLRGSFPWLSDERSQNSTTASSDEVTIIKLSKMGAARSLHCKILRKRLVKKADSKLLEYPHRRE
jgi:hypothetical protein